MSVTEMQTEYPVPIYRFNVNFDGQDYPFSEVSGLEIQHKEITYRDGLGAKYMPGMEEPIKLTMKRGVVKKGNHLYAWINSISLNTVDKKNITVSLVDNKNAPVVSWAVQGAFPVKLTAPTFDAKSNEVAIESLE
jgi:phage tail-like protein